MTHMTYIAHMIKLLFKAYKKSDKIFFDNFFFLYIKMVKNYYKKHKERLHKEARERYLECKK